MTSPRFPHPHLGNPLVPQQDHRDRLLLLAVLVVALPTASLLAMLALL